MSCCQQSLPTPLLARARSSAPERGHPRASLLDEHAWAHDPHTLTRSEVPHVVGHQERRTGTDRRGEDWRVLLVSQGASPFPVLSRGPIDPHGYRAEEFLEERQGLRDLVAQVPPDLVDYGLRKDQPEEADLTQDQDGVARTRARQEAGDEDVGIEADRDGVSLPGRDHQDL
jgi:hypothetical protein